MHAIVTGRVQGVFFRQSTVDEARRLGVSGWVRNRRDGTVELLAEGDIPMLERLLAWLHHGPDGARVLRVDVMWADGDGTLPQPFRVEQTA